MQTVYEDDTFRVLYNGLYWYPQLKGTGILTQWGYIYLKEERIYCASLARAMEFHP